MSPKAIAVKRDRTPARSLAPLPEQNDFCVSRVLAGCGLKTILSFHNLRTAKSYMNRLAARVPGSYVLFSKASGEVLAKIVRHADA